MENPGPLRIVTWFENRGDNSLLPEHGVRRKSALDTSSLHQSELSSLKNQKYICRVYMQLQIKFGSPATMLQRNFHEITRLRFFNSADCAFHVTYVINALYQKVSGVHRNKHDKH